MKGPQDSDEQRGVRDYAAAVHGERRRKKSRGREKAT